MQLAGDALLFRHRPASESVVLPGPESLVGRKTQLVQQPVDRRGLAVSLVMTLTLLVCATYAFKRLEDEFADVV